MKNIETFRRKIVFLYLILLRSLSRFFRKTFNRNDLRSQPKNSIGRQYVVAALGVFIVVFVAIKFGVGSFRQETVSEGIIGLYTGNTLPMHVSGLVSSPLVSLDKTGRPEPNLSSGWQVNNDATVYTFKLKDNLYWNDGTKLKSSDIKFNLRDVEISYPDSSTIQFKLADSFYPFPSLLTAPVFKGDSLIGIGKYKVSSQSLSRNIITKLALTPNDMSQNLPVVNIRFYPDEQTAKTAFYLGEVQSLLGVHDEGEFKSQPGVKMKKVTNFNKLVAIFYNTKDAVLSDKNLRKALSFATPKIEGEDLAKSSIPPSSWGYNNNVKEMVGDLELSKSYLEKSEGKVGTVALTTTPLFADLGEKIIKAWKASGITAVLRVESGVPQNFQALLIAQTIPSDPDQYALWHSTQVQTNLSRYDTNKRADKDLEDGRKTGDLEKRREKYLDLQKVLADDVPATFLYFQKSWVVYLKKTEGTLSKVLSLQLPQN